MTHKHLHSTQPFHFNADDGDNEGRDHAEDNYRTGNFKHIATHTKHISLTAMINGGGGNGVGKTGYWVNGAGSGILGEVVVNP